MPREPQTARTAGDLLSLRAATSTSLCRISLLPMIQPAVTDHEMVTMSNERCRMTKKGWTLEDGDTGEPGTARASHRLPALLGKKDITRPFAGFSRR